MAMTLEEQAAFDAMKAENEKNKAEIESLKAAAAKAGKNNEQMPTNKESEEPSALEEARKMKEAEEEKANKEKRIIEGAKFIATFDNFIKEAGDFFPKEAAAAIEVVNKRKYDDEMERADDLRAAIAESVFSIQSNLDLLPAIGQEKVNAFMDMTQKAKQKNAQGIWEYVLAAYDTFKRTQKQERAEAARRGLGTASEDVAKYESKIFGLRKPKEEKK